MSDPNRTADSPLDNTQMAHAPTLAGNAPSEAIAGRYQLLHELARGGMGVVYAARDTVFDRDVAVKLIQPDRATPTAERRFTDEARITARLQHPGIPAVFDMGTLPDSRTFLAMKLVRGRTLADVLADPARGPLLPAFEQLCHAVGYAHSRGVIHRDLKPANVMIGAFGEVQVMDWGLAKFLASVEASARREMETPDTSTIHDPRADPDSSGTRAGSILGTPAFMPPEQAIGAIDQTDERADVFGLGAILCTILTGQPPWVGVTGESTRQLAARAELAPAFARLDASGGEPDLIALAKRCLSAKPEDRPRHAGEVAAAVTTLRAAADARAKQAEQDKLTAEVRAAEQAKRRRAVQWAAGVVAAVLLLGVAGTTLGLIRANAARKDAEAAERATEAKRVEAEMARAEAVAKEAEANAVMKFIEEKVFIAARPKEQAGGLGRDVSLRAAITASLPALSKGFADQPLIEARLRMTLGTTFWCLGNAGAAMKEYDQARAIYTERRGPDHPDTLRSMNNLANSYADLNRHADALKLYEETLAIRKRVLPPDHPETLSSLWGVADSLASLGKGAEAIPRIDECVTQATGKAIDPRMIPAVMYLRIRHFEKIADPAGCRATAEMWEKLNRPDADSQYDAACMRAIAGGLYAKSNQPAAAAADADRAMAWLILACASGWKDRDRTETDTDLDFLRNRADFRALVATLRYRAPLPRSGK